jgi:hypothetical protein
MGVVKGAGHGPSTNSKYLSDLGLLELSDVAKYHYLSLALRERGDQVPYFARVRR